MLRHRTWEQDPPGRWGRKGRGTTLGLGRTAGSLGSRSRKSSAPELTRAGMPYLIARRGLDACPSVPYSPVAARIAARISSDPTISSKLATIRPSAPTTKT